MKDELPADVPKDAPIRVAVAVVADAGRYLIGLRPPGVPLAGLWEFPGGKIRAGETPEQAAVRECREETALLVEIVGRYESVVQDYAHGRIEIFFLACRVLARPAEPLAPFRWVAAAELCDYEFPAANAALLRQLTARE